MHTHWHTERNRERARARESETARERERDIDTHTHTHTHRRLEPTKTNPVAFNTAQHINASQPKKSNLTPRHRISTAQPLSRTPPHKTSLYTVHAPPLPPTPLQQRCCTALGMQQQHASRAAVRLLHAHTRSAHHAHARARTHTHTHRRDAEWAAVGMRESGTARTF